MYNSEDTCKTMSLHVTRLNASLRTHPLPCPTCTRASFPTVSPLQHSIYCKTCVHYSHQFLPWHHPSQHHCSMGHLRAPRDTGNTCHGPPDLGEGSSRAHTCTTCPWNAERERQDYGCTCMCGDSRGCPTSSGDKPICTYIY